ncbi:hypothetical protein [Glutamicibacter sp. NPDC087344]|uniref:hypothetical protein n=1 Tax=Glutamicibacter sp. NPDC087344 TaxID=3363994 RepID=UPI00380095C1
MRHKPVIPVLLIAALLMFLDVALLTYRSAQEALLREANALYSSNAVAVTGEASKALAIAQHDDLDVLLFLPIQNNDKLRAVISAQGNLDMIPKHRVRWNVSDARPGAFAGANVAPASGHVDVLGTDYPIAGLLGTQDQSLAADDILVYDPTFFTETTMQRFVIDGSDASVVAEKFNDARPVSESISRRTNLDFVTPVMVSLSLILLILGSALAGYLANEWGAARDSINRLWGRSRPMILIRRTAIYALVWVGAASIAGGVLRSLNSAGTLFHDFALSCALLLGVFLLAFGISFAVRNRG